MTEMVAGGEGTPATQTVSQFREAAGLSIVDTNKSGNS